MTDFKYKTIETLLDEYRAEIRRTCRKPLSRVMCSVFAGDGCIARGFRFTTDDKSEVAFTVIDTDGESYDLSATRPGRSDFDSIFIDSPYEFPWDSGLDDLPNCAASSVRSIFEYVDIEFERSHEFIRSLITHAKEIRDAIDGMMSTEIKDGDTLYSKFCASDNMISFDIQDKNGISQGQVAISSKRDSRGNVDYLVQILDDEDNQRISRFDDFPESVRNFVIEYFNMDDAEYKIYEYYRRIQDPMDLPKIKVGRPTKVKEGQNVSCYMTPKQAEVFKELGGSEWLRNLLDQKQEELML